MAEPLRKSEESPRNAEEARKKAVELHRPAPTETTEHGMVRAPGGASLGDDIRAHTNRPHKGDVGRPGTNEEVFQGSKEKELR